MDTLNVKIVCKACKSANGTAKTTGRILTSYPGQEEYKWTCGDCGGQQTFGIRLPCPETPTYRTLR